MRKIEKIQKGIETLFDDPVVMRQIIEEICKTEDKINELVDAVNALATEKDKAPEEELGIKISYILPDGSVITERK